MGEPKYKNFPGFDAFNDVEGCKMHFSGDVDDPGALCRWIQEHGKDALDDPEAEDVLVNVGTEFVSGVDTPAQDSQWLIAKDVEGPDGENHSWKSDAPLVIHKGDNVDKAGDDARQITFAPVLIPGEADKQGDVIPDFEIERAAHNYLKNARHVDTDHDLLDGKGDPIESYTLPEETTFTLPDGSESREYPKGTWIMGIQWGETAWKRIKSGDLNGLSIYGGATSVPVDELLNKDADPDDRQSVALDVTAKSAISDDEADALQSLTEDMADEVDADPSDITVVEFVDWATSDESDDEDADDGNEESDSDGSDDDPDESEEESKSKSMTNEDDTPGDTGDETEDEQTAKENRPEWADDLRTDIQETVKSEVGDVREDVDALQNRVDSLEKDVNDDPKGDRMEEDDGGDRMEKSADTDDDDDGEIEETVRSTMDDYFGVEGEDDRKAIREQVTKSDGTDTDTIDVGFDPDADEATPNSGGNPRMESDD